MSELVGTIKELQRGDPSAKVQWWAYCDAMGGGVHDPAKHEETFMQEFLDNYNSGRRFEPSQPAATPYSPPHHAGGYGAGAGAGAFGAGGGGNPLAALCKEGQKRSHNWKNCWAQYCAHYGNGRNDPEKHDVTFITGFLDYVAGRGIQALSAGGAAAPDFGPPAKRPRVAAPAAGGFPGAAMPMSGAFGGDGKNELVMSIKAFQKSSPEAKEQWGNYCDEHLGGVRDPNRHDPTILKSFIQNYGIP
uniref:Uncharacterized protein n=1 Tax=Alexandrium catenella TaxID=2925 RepID=A0A7S1S631_ALECA